jgi:PGF-pre-PGF domain-containing protein
LLLCRVIDANTTKPIENYTVSFYDNTSFLGSALTNSSGFAKITYAWEKPGTYKITCNISDTPKLFYNVSFGERIDWLKVNDTEPPKWFSLVTSSPSVFYGEDFVTNVTWNDNAKISLVFFESNFSGEFKNYTVQNISNIFSFTIKSGNHSVGKLVVWRWCANDTSNNWNCTEKFNYTVLKTPTIVRLWFNGTENNMTYTNNTIINITALVNITEKNITLLANFSGKMEPVANGTEMIHYTINTSLLNITAYNITAWFKGDENYTESFVSYLVWIKKYDGLACSSNKECYSGFCVHSVCRASSPYCGDGFCDQGESCSSCPQDCGNCPSTTSSFISTTTLLTTITSISKQQAPKVIVTENELNATFSLKPKKKTLIQAKDFVIRQIEISGKVKKTVRLSVKKISAIPKTPKENVYQYLKIETNIKPEEVEIIKINFSVEKSWVEENDINESTISLQKYISEWKKLPTEFLYEDEKYLYYQAVLSSFSLFAITGEKRVKRCPFECCVGEKYYIDKLCPEDFECRNNKCVRIKCPSCPPCSQWSECKEGKQTRTCYVCSEKTNYTCIPKKEEVICKAEEEKGSTILLGALFILTLLLFLFFKILYKKHFVRSSNPFKSHNSSLCKRLQNLAYLCL